MLPQAHAATACACLLTSARTSSSVLSCCVAIAGGAAASPSIGSDCAAGADPSEKFKGSKEGVAPQRAISAAISARSSSGACKRSQEVYNRSHELYVLWACCAVAEATLAKSPPESQACNIKEA